MESEKKETSHAASSFTEDRQSLDQVSKETLAPNATALTDNPKTETENDGEQQVLSGYNLYILLFALTFVMFLTMLNSSIIGTAIPQVTDQFSSVADIGWYGSAYSLANCAIQPLTGKIYSGFSLKSTYLAFLGLYILGSLICGAANSSRMLIVGRAVAGMGASSIMNGGLTIVAAAVSTHRRPVVIGAMLSTALIGSVAGPLLGGVLTQRGSWRWAFYFNLPVGGFAWLLLATTHIPEQRNKSNIRSNIGAILHELDLLGFVLFAPACIMFLMAVNWGGSTYDWNSATIIGLFCGSLVTICIFIAWEYRRGDTAMIPLAMLRQPVILCSCWTAGFHIGGLLLLTYYLPVWFQAILNASPIKSGIDILPSVVSEIVFSLVAGILVMKLGYYTPWAITGSALVTIGSGLMSTFVPTTYSSQWIGYQILAGSGRGMVLQMPITAVQSVLPLPQVAIGTALVVFSQFFGSALLIALGQTIFVNKLRSALAEYAPEVHAQDVIDAGATRIREVVSARDFPGVLIAYNRAVTATFYLAAGVTTAAFFTSWGLGWKNLKKKKKETGSNKTEEP